MRYKFSIIVLLIILLVPCVSAAPISQFLLSSTGGTGPVSITFTDKSITSPTAWTWSSTLYINGVYSSGPTTFSTSQNPVQTFGATGLNYEYKISLLVTNASGTNTSVQNTWINTTSIQAACMRTGSYPTYTFADASTGGSPSQVMWNFGDTSNTAGNYYNSSLVLDITGNITPFTDSSQYANPITMYGNTTIGSGPGGMGSNGGAINFDGINGSYTSVKYNSNYNFGSNPFTIHCQFKTGPTSQAYSSIYSNEGDGAGNTVLLLSSGAIAFYTIGGPIPLQSSTTGYNNNEWHSLVISRGNNGIYNMWVDEVDVANTTNTGSITASAYPLVIGSSVAFASRGFNGKIANFKIWNGVAVPISAFSQTPPYTYQPGNFGGTPPQIPLTTGSSTTHTYTSTPSNNVTEIVWDQYGGYSSTNIPILSSFNRVDLQMTQRALLTIVFKDMSTNEIIPVVTVVDSNGYTETTVNGIYTHTYDYGTIVLYFASAGYRSKSASYIMSGDRSETVLLSLTAAVSSQSTWWTPHTVQVTIFDLYGNPLEDVAINATYNEASMPTNWLTSLYGIRDAPAADMINSSLILYGTTGTDGSMTFTMLGSLKYDIYLTSSTYGLNDYHVTAYPSDSMLNIYVPTLSSIPIVRGNSTYSQLNGSRVYATEPDIGNVSMCIDYRDTSGLTSSVSETWLFKNNNTVMHTETITPGIILNTNCYTIANVRGTQVWWGYNATRTGA